MAFHSDAIGIPPDSAMTHALELWGYSIAPFYELALHRRALADERMQSDHEIYKLQAQLRALDYVAKSYYDRLIYIERKYRIQLKHGSPPSFFPLPSASASAWLSEQQQGSWTLDALQASALTNDLAEAERCLAEAAGRIFGGNLRQQGNNALARVSKRLDGLKNAASRTNTELSRQRGLRDESVNLLLTQAHESLGPIMIKAKDSSRLLPTLLQPWDSPSWDVWEKGGDANLGLAISYGGTRILREDPRLGEHRQFGTDVATPWGFNLHDCWFIEHNASTRADAHAFVRSQMVRHLLTVPPGDLSFCIFDPIGLGQSVRELLDLAEYDPRLIGSKVWSGSRNLEDRLNEYSNHIELVIQKYLRASFANIQEFNLAAGEIAEPYRILIIFDFPTGFTPEAARLLQSIVQNGPRCGVFAMICCDPQAEVPFGVNLPQIKASMSTMICDSNVSIELDGFEHKVIVNFDALPQDSPLVKRIVEEIGRSSLSRSEAAVSFDRVFQLYTQYAARGLRPELIWGAESTLLEDPSTWWHAATTVGVYGPIGQRGARDVAVLALDSSDHAGALLVGRPGSGKSTLLHAYIASITTLYSPEELHLYLIDFKEGVEFKAYAEYALPHAKIIATESDREFGMTVLESVRGEIIRRAQVFRDAGGRQAGLQSWREATGEIIPRLVLVFDEFQVLFSRTDKIGTRAADLMEQIIRQGRGFGVHVVLGSQSLAGLDALGAHVPQLLPVRILLAATDADARRVLGDSNSAGDYLTSSGEGILNPAGGAVEANERFRGAFLTESERVARIRALRAKADASGFRGVPLVFEGNALVSLEGVSAQEFKRELTGSGRYPLRLRAGEARTAGDVQDLILAREGGSNVVAIVRSGVDDEEGLSRPSGTAYGLLCAGVASALSMGAEVYIVDFMPNDDGLDLILDPALAVGSAILRRRTAFAAAVRQCLEEAHERISHGVTGRPSIVLFLFGVHRARALDLEGIALDADSQVADDLESLMRDGPEVGVHVWLWSESVAAAARRLTPRMMREASWRVSGKMSRDDALNFVGTEHAADLRDNQLLVVNEDRGIARTLTAYAVPSADWMTGLLR